MEGTPVRRRPPIHEQFDMSSTRCYQILNALIDKPAAHAASPLFVLLEDRLTPKSPTPGGMGLWNGSARG